ncbi:hypothetical protein ACLKA7_015964 [Drosophila subpalustris]
MWAWHLEAQKDDDDDEDEDVDVANDKCQAPGRCDWQQPSSKLIAHNLEKWVQVGEVWIVVVPQSTHQKSPQSTWQRDSSIELKSLDSAVLLLLQILFLPQLPPSMAAKSRPFVTLLVRRLCPGKVDECSGDHKQSQTEGRLAVAKDRRRRHPGYMATRPGALLRNCLMSCVLHPSMDNRQWATGNWQLKCERVARACRARDSLRSWRLRLKLQIAGLITLPTDAEACK